MFNMSSCRTNFGTSWVIEMIARNRNKISPNVLFPCSLRFIFNPGFTVKRFNKQGDQFFLTPDSFNPMYKPVHPKFGQEWEIIGVLTYSIKEHRCSQDKTCQPQLWCKCYRNHSL